MRPRDNPFAVQRLDRLPYRVPAGGWEALLGRLDDLGGRAAVVGPEGSGKTALLEALDGRLAAAGRRTLRLRLHRGERRLDAERRARVDAARAAGAAILVDGADELGPLSWHRLRRRTRGTAALVIAARRDGLLPTLHRCTPSPALLADLVATLHPPCHCALPSAETLFARHRGNLRAALLELYDLHAALPPGAQATRGFARPNR